jgi:BRCT domain type II-containing protein
MSIVAASVSVTTSATKLAENTAVSVGADSDKDTISFLLKNITASATIYLAGANTVTTANGWPWETGDGPISVDLEPGEALWGIVAVTTQTVNTLRQGR